uniref:Fungal-type protein kinase domain-containing protein n=1 Tax=Moniliophthora roreri TaxID=221103 RepID=A0A0W0G1S6_MONRR
MGSDPTRRFAYGLTIEHNNTRFWFCSRSHIFITESLDLQKNIKDVIYFVMALGSASKEQLGFDPTVRRVKRSSSSKVKTHYQFTINGIEYETLEAISIYKAKFLLGRANHVFKVQRVVSDELIGPVFVLKDLWLPEGAKTELEIQEDMKANINKVHVVEGLDATDFEKHFVAIKYCEIVKVPSMTNLSELSSSLFRHATDLLNCSLHNWNHVLQHIEHVTQPKSLLLAACKRCCGELQFLV